MAVERSHVEDSAQQQPQTLEELRRRRCEILQVARLHGAHQIAVFGSVARGEAGPDSDVDFLVELEPGRSLLDLGGLLMDLRDLLGRPVDVVTRAGLRGRIRAQVLRDSVPL
ncbi:MAG: nucleotidyltransferase family protein [Egibacteraceae bacterium]